MSASLLPLQLQALHIKYRARPLQYVSATILCVSTIVLGLSAASLAQRATTESGVTSQLALSGVIIHGVVCVCSLLSLVIAYYVSRIKKRALNVCDMRVFTFYLGLVACSSISWGASVIHLISGSALLWGGGILSVISGCLFMLAVIGKIQSRAYFICAVYFYYSTRKMVWKCYKASCWKHKRKFLYVSEAGGEKTSTIVTEMPQPNGSVRFVVVSDTHLTHWEIAIPQGDVLLHAGDILQYDRGTDQVVRGRNDGEDTLKDFNKWLGSLKGFCHRVVIGGNHDRALHELGPDRARKVLSNATYLCDDWAELTFPESITNRKITIFGSPMSAGRSDNCAFQLSREEMNSRLQNLLTRPTDILLTHSMPWPEEISPGTPRYHVCGHEHGAHGAHYRTDASGREYTIINGAICNHHYCPSHPPIVFDFDFK